MSNDIVARLRRENDCLLPTGLDISDVLLPAAAEIERLRAENEKLKTTDMAIAMVEMSLRDEIKRLRLRLEINDDFPDCDGIESRNETIKLQDTIIKRLEANIEMLANTVRWYADPEAHMMSKPWVRAQHALKIMEDKQHTLKIMESLLDEVASALCNYIKNHPSNFIFSSDVYPITHTDEQRNKYASINFRRANTEVSLAIYGPQLIWCKTNQKKFGGMFAFTLYNIDEAKEFIDQIGNS